MPDNHYESSLKDEIISEVSTQVKRKLMDYLPGDVNLADAVELYSNAAAGARGVWDTDHTKSGEKNRNPQNKGNFFEELDVYDKNREEILNGSDARWERTERTYQRDRRGEKLSASEKKFAIHNHSYADTIKTINGKVVETSQLKAIDIKKTRQLLHDRYLLNDTIVVPKEDESKHRKNLEEIKRTTDPDDKRHKNAVLALQKLKGSRISSDALTVGSAYGEILKQSATDAGTRIGSRAGAQIATIAVGGVIYEFKEYATDRYSMTMGERAGRLVQTVFTKAKEQGLATVGKEVSLELVQAVLGIVATPFTSLKALAKLIGQSLKQVWDCIYDYITGHITSFAQLMSRVIKVLASVCIGFIAVKLETIMRSVGVPPWLSAILVACLAGVTIALVSYGVDKLIFGMLAAFSQAKAARLRRENIEAMCDELLPQLEENRVKLEQAFNIFLAQRGRIANQGFAEIAAARETGNVLAEIQGLATIAKAYGHELQWKTQAEFDLAMESDGPLIIG